MAADPAFASVNPRVAVGVISTANTNRDGTGTGPATAIFTAPAAAAGPPVLAGGSKIEEITVIAAGTTTAGKVLLYLYDGSGTDGHLFDEVQVVPLTLSASQVSFRSTKIYSNLMLPPGWSITASTLNAETFQVHVFGGDF